MHFIVFGVLPELNGLSRPKTFYGQTVHDRCLHRPFYEVGMFAKIFDDVGVRLSQHQMTFQEVLALASFRSKLSAHLIAVQPDDISLGVELSPTVEAAMDHILMQAEGVLRRWG